MLKNYMPNDKVKTCAQMEKGLAFEPDGLYFCCVSTFLSPKIFSPQEIHTGLATYEAIRKKRIELFHYLNSGDQRAGSCLTCGAVYETEFKNVSFDLFGGGNLNIQHFRKCNLRCKYCLFTQQNNFSEPHYTTDDILKILNEYASINKIAGRSWISANGGEPSILKGYGDFCNSLNEMGLGDVCIFSNCVKHDAKIAELLKEDKIFITVSLDAGIPTTFAEVRGAPAMWKVADTLVRYRKTGTHRLWLKYIITEDNCNEDNLFGFVFFMTALRPDKVYICPEFPYGDRETPYKFVTFGAKMWYLLKKYANTNIHIQTDDNIADPKFKKYSDNIRKEFAKLNQSKTLDNTYTLIESDEKINSALNKQIKCIINRFKETKRESYNIYEKITERICSFLFPQNYIQQYIRSSLLFDNEFYKSQLDSSICNNSIDGIEHYCLSGWKEGKNPNNWFNTNAYLKAYPDVNINPFYHYLRYGIFEMRSLQ